jgi:hypothetical protein
MLFGKILIWNRGSFNLSIMKRIQNGEFIRLIHEIFSTCLDNRRVFEMCGFSSRLIKFISTSIKLPLIISLALIILSSYVKDKMWLLLLFLENRPLGIKLPPPNTCSQRHSCIICHSLVMLIPRVILEFVFVLFARISCCSDSVSHILIGHCAISLT